MSTLRCNAIQDTSGVERFLSRAWVNFDGTGSVTIRSAGNVSSITDNGTGSYTVNFSSAMPDTNFSTLVTPGFFGATGMPSNADSASTGAQTTTSVRVFVRSSSTSFDPSTLSVAIFR